MIIQKRKNIGGQAFEALLKWRIDVVLWTGVAWTIIQSTFLQKNKKLEDYVCVGFFKGKLPNDLL